MPQIGPLEIATVFVIALIAFGPRKLPELARTIGKAMGELRRMAADVKDEFESGLDEPDEMDEPEPAKDIPPNPDALEL